MSQSVQISVTLKRYQTLTRGDNAPEAELNTNHIYIMSSVPLKARNVLMIRD